MSCRRGAYTMIQNSRTAFLSPHGTVFHVRARSERTFLLLYDSQIGYVMNVGSE